MMLSNLDANDYMSLFDYESLSNKQNCKPARALILNNPKEASNNDPRCDYSPSFSNAFTPSPSEGIEDAPMFQYDFSEDFITEGLLLGLSPRPFTESVRVRTSQDFLPTDVALISNTVQETSSSASDSIHLTSNTDTRKSSVKTTASSRSMNTNKKAAGRDRHRNNEDGNDSSGSESRSAGTSSVNKEGEYTYVLLKSKNNRKPRRRCREKHNERERNRLQGMANTVDNLKTTMQLQNVIIKDSSKLGVLETSLDHINVLKRELDETESETDKLNSEIALLRSLLLQATKVKEISSNSSCDNTDIVQPSNPIGVTPKGAEPVTTSFDASTNERMNNKVNYENIFTSNNIPTMVFNMNGEILGGSHLFLLLSGYSNEEIHLKNAYDLFSPPATFRGNVVKLNSMDSFLEEETVECQLQLILKDGRQCVVMTRMKLIFDDLNGLSSILTTFLPQIHTAPIGSSKCIYGSFESSIIDSKDDPSYILKRSSMNEFVLNTEAWFNK